MIDRFGIRAGANQQLRRLDVVPIYRPMQCRRSVRLRAIHVGVLLQEQANSGCVSFHHRIGKAGLSGGDSGCPKR
jgi:hypothetical protein